MRYRHSEHITWDRADDRVVLLDPAGSSLITLNPVGSLLWPALAEPCSAETLVDDLGRQFPEVERDRLSADVEQFLASLLTEGALVGVDAAETDGVDVDAAEADRGDLGSVDVGSN